jgi:hypothetical protein
MFLSTMEVLAKFNARTLNKVTDPWEGNDLREIIPESNIEFTRTVWPGVVGAMAQVAPGIFEAAGVMPADDPLWDAIHYFVEKQVDFGDLGALEGNLMNLCVVHGDARSENIFYPLSREGIPALIDFQLMKFMPPAFDPYYFLVTSVPAEWRQEHELEMMNVYLKG